MKFKAGMLAAALLMAMPTAFAEHDVLLETNPATAIMGTDDYLIPTVYPDTKAAIHTMATNWAKSRQAIQEAYEHRNSGAELTKADKAWLKSDQANRQIGKRHSYSELFDTHIIGRVHFYERSHNWNGENRDKKEYNYFTYDGPGNTDPAEYINSYGFNVLRTMADTMRESMKDAEGSNLQGDAFVSDVEQRLTSIMEDTQKTVYNDELRYYINATVEYTAKQVTKERLHHDEPLLKDIHVVNLRESIQMKK